MDDKWVWAFLTCTAVIVSGCASGAPAATKTTDAAPIAPTAEVTEDTGGITGLVTDIELVPLPGVNVSLVEDPTRQVLTTEGGAFAFGLLPPGVYDVQAVLDGYHISVRTATVIVGSVTDIQIFLEPLPSTRAYHAVTLRDGFMECAFAVIRVTLPGDCSPTSSARYINEKHSLALRNYTALVFEADWKTQDVLGFDVRDDTAKGMYYRIRAASPVRIQMERCGDYREAAFATHILHCTDEEVAKSRLEVVTTYMGRFRQETRALDPLCLQPVPHPAGGNLFGPDKQGCYGVGVALDLRWKSYGTVFYFATPGDLDRYSGRPDG